MLAAPPPFLASNAPVPCVLRAVCSSPTKHAAHAPFTPTAAATGRPPLLGLRLAPGLDELQPAGSGAAVQLLRIEGAPPRAAPATKLAAAAEPAEGMSAECQRLVAERQPLHRRFVRRGKSAGSMVTMPFALCATQQPDAKSFTLVTHTDIRVPQELLDPNQASAPATRRTLPGVIARFPPLVPQPSVHQRIVPRGSLQRVAARGSLPLPLTGHQVWAC